jgi:hypothetical protein
MINIVKGVRKSMMKSYSAPKIVSQQAIIFETQISGGSGHHGGGDGGHGGGHDGGHGGGHHGH